MIDYTKLVKDKIESPYKELIVIQKHVRYIEEHCKKNKLFDSASLAVCLNGVIDVLAIHLASNDELKQIIKTCDEYSARQVIIEDLKNKVNLND